MESFYEIEDELRACIIDYIAVCEERKLDPTEQLNNLIEEELKDI